jgi:hypothetical protein
MINLKNGKFNPNDQFNDLMFYYAYFIYDLNGLEEDQLPTGNVEPNYYLLKYLIEK